MKRNLVRSLLGLLMVAGVILGLVSPASAAPGRVWLTTTAQSSGCFIMEMKVGSQPLSPGNTFQSDWICQGYAAVGEGTSRYSDFEPLRVWVPPGNCVAYTLHESTWQGPVCAYTSNPAHVYGVWTGNLWPGDGLTFDWHIGIHEYQN